MQYKVISGISPRFRGLSQSQGQVTHVLLTRSPLEYPRRGLSARLACVKHAASVRPEPGSNSPLKNNTTTTQTHGHGKKSRIPGKKQTSDIIARIIVLPKKPSTITSTTHTKRRKR